MIPNGLQEFLIGFVNSTTSVFSSNAFYLVLFICSILLIWTSRNESKRSFRLLITYSALIAVIVFNPLLRNAFMLLPATNEGVIERFWMICPIWMIVACAMTLVVSKRSKKPSKVLYSAIIALVIICGGSSIVFLNMMIESANEYKISNTALELADQVLEINNGEPTSLMVFVASDQFGEDNYLHGGSTCNGISQYTGNIQVHRFAYLDEQWNDYFVCDRIPDGTMSGEQYVNYFFDIYFEPYGIEYAALPNDERIIPYMEYSGYEKVGEADCYYIFKEMSE